MNETNIPVAEFERWLRLGLGRTLLYLQQHDAAPYREVLVAACRNDWRHDPQCEETRAPYLWELIAATGETAYYRERVLAELASAKEDGGEVQLFQLAGRFAQAGDAEARRLMYKRFIHDDEKAVTCALELVELDGVDGLVFVAEQLGPEAGEDDWGCAYVLSRAAEIVGDQAHFVLERTAVANMGIRSFLWAVEREQQRDERIASQAENDATGRTYVELRPLLLSGEHVRRLPAWGKVANDDDIRSAANDLVELVISGSDPRRWRPFVWLFRNRTYPYDPQPIIEAAERANSRQARAILIGLLRNVKHPAARSAALRNLESSQRQVLGVDLLLANYDDGDFVMIQQAAECIVDHHVLHSFGMSVCDLLGQHTSSDAVPTLLHLYEHNPCSTCRKDFVSLLIDYDALPARLVEECRYDADPELREVIEERFGRPPPPLPRLGEGAGG